MDSTWAFCRDSSRDDILTALRENLAARIEGASFDLVENPDDFYPDHDYARRDAGKEQWKQISYYVATRGAWTCFSYATGGEPFEMEEPAVVARTTGRPVLEIGVTEEGAIRLSLYESEGPPLVMDNAGGLHRGEQTVEDQELLDSLGRTFGEPASDELLRDLTTGWARTAAVTFHLGIVPDESGLEYFEPEDLYDDGSIFAFNRS